MTRAQLAALQPAERAEIARALDDHDAAVALRTHRTFSESPQWCGLALSPLMAAIMDAAEGIRPTRIDDATCTRHFGCALDQLPRVARRLVAVRAGGRAGKTSRLMATKALHAALTVALHDLGDRVALFAYNSHGRQAVNLLPVKRFDEALGTVVLRRLNSLEPTGYSRLGAAIRHGTAVLEADGGTARRLLVVLSDGLAYDHGYEREHGAADARRALTEARRRGTGCVCLTVGAGTEVAALRAVFGSAAHATVGRPDQLPAVIGPLFRAAIRSAEVRRRLS